MTFRLAYARDADGAERLDLDVEPASDAEVEQARSTFLEALVRVQPPVVRPPAERFAAGGVVKRLQDPDGGRRGD